MAKKSSKSKVVKPLAKKYQSAGYNMSGIDPSVRSYYLGKDQASMAERQYRSIYNRTQDFQNQASEEERQILEDKKEANRQLKQYSREGEKQFVSDAATKLAQEGTAALAKKAAEKAAAKEAAKQAAEKTAKTAVTAAGANAATNAASSTANALAQGIAPSMSIQAARGSGMEAARLAQNMFDETGNFVPQTMGLSAKSATEAAAGTAGTVASTAGQGMKILGSNMSGLASAGIGLGLTGAGMLINKKTNDNDYTTFTDKERKGMKRSAALQGAGSGFSTGAMLGSAIPGVGNVVGGVVGAGLGAGLALLRSKETIKEAEETAKNYQDEEAKRKAAIAAQDAQLAAAYNAAFVKSRLSGAQTGFGLNSSTTPGMDTTSSFYGETGGARRVPGGQIVPMKGDAVKFIGKKHSQGGIKLDPQTEVEGGETMDQVQMSNGKPNDYFFSAYLKLGGKSFAKRHEEILKSGGTQRQIQDLAKMQELAANKKGEKDRGPEQVAKYGGIHKYQTAGTSLSAGPSGKPVYKPADAMTDEEYDIYYNSEGDSQRAVAPNLPWVKNSGEKTLDGNAQATYNFGAKPSATTNNSRRPGPDSTAAEQVDSKGSKTPQQSADAQSNTAAKTGTTVRDSNKANAKAPKDQASVAPGGTTNNAGQASADAASKATTTNTTGTGSTANSTSSVGFPEGRRAINKDEYGESTSMKGVPKGQKGGTKFFGNVTEQQYSDMMSANPWYDFTNFDPSKKDFKNPDGSMGSSDVAKFQREYNEHVRTGEKLKVDGKFGEQTATSRIHIADLKKIEPRDVELPREEISLKDTGLPKEEEKKVEEQQKIERAKKGVNGSLIAGLAQLIPVGYSLARPYKAAAGIESQAVGAGSVRGAVLPRVNMNAERAAAISNTVAVRKMAESQSGPGSMIAAIAAGGQQGDQMLAIANQEQRANRELIAEEAKLGQRASEFNATQAQTADMANAENRSKTDMFNKQLEVSEKQYKREGTLNALDAAAARIAGVVKDERSYRAQERLAKALDATGSYDRFTIYEELQKEAQNSDSPYHNMTDAQLKKIASDAYNQQWGKQGGEGDKAATGGARKYTSRLGQLSRGRKTFNI